MRSVTFTLGQPDLQAAILQSIWTRRLSLHPLAKFMIGPLLLAFLVFYMLGAGGQEQALPRALLAFVAFAATTLVSEALAAAVQSRMAARNPFYTHEQTFEWDDAGFSIRSSRGETRMGWRDLAGFAADGRVLLLHFQTGQFQPLPRRVFTDPDWTDLRKMVVAAGVPDWTRWH
jgi:hypothetical protein